MSDNHTVSKYQPLFDQLSPETGRTFFVDYKPFRGYGRNLVKGAVRRWAKKHRVAVGIKITNPHLTGQQILISVK